jgi:hypothetical protein
VKPTTLAAAASTLAIVVALAPGTFKGSPASSTVRAATVRTLDADAASGAPRQAAPVFASSYGTQVWSGYVDVADPNVKFRYVESSFTIPAVTCTSLTSKASFWVGLDGFGTSTVEQAGLSTDCSIGRPNYRVWYEMFPHGVVFMPFHPRVGDHLTAAVFFNYSTGVYNLSVTDREASLANFNVQQRCPSGHTCQNATAEAVLEADNGTNLSRFTQVSFVNSVVTSRNGTHGTFKSSSLWTSNKPVMTGSNGQPLANISGLGNNGENFSITYHEAH